MRTAAPCRRLLLATALACGLPGCTRTIVDRPVPTAYDPSITQQRVAFWHALPGRSAITNDEGLHAVLLFLEGDDPTRSYEERLAYAKSRSLVGEAFDEPAAMAMQRGTLARALVRGLGIEGGVMLGLTQQHPRYATKELQYLGIMGAGTEIRVISGLDLLGIMTNAEAYRSVHRAPEPAQADDDDEAPEADPPPADPDPEPEADG